MIIEHTDFVSQSYSSTTVQNGNEKPRKLTVLKKNINGDKSTTVTINKPLKKDIIKKVKNESMGLAAVGGIPSPYNTLYLTQYSMPTTFAGSDSLVDGYGISNDIISDKILTKNSDGKLVLEDTESLFENRNIRIFKYIGNDNTENIFKECFSNLNQDVSDSFLYEMVTTKKLLSDDQLSVDPLFEEVDLNKIMGSIDSEIISNEESIMRLSGEEIIDKPLIDPKDINEAKELNAPDYITVCCCEEGYYARNDVNLKRTACYKNISDIPVSIIY